MSVIIYSKQFSQDVNDKIIGDNYKKLLEDYHEDYIKKELGIE